MRVPFSFVKSSTAAHNPASDNLSLWLRSPDSVTGTLGTLSWASKASAGTSGAAAPMLHSVPYSDLVEQPSTAIDAYTSVYWRGANPLLESTDKVRALLGAGDSTPASYTVAYVAQPVASNTYGLNAGKTYNTNAAFYGDPYGFVTHAIMDDAGTCKVGVFHYNEDTAAGDGTTPVIWPGGFTAWGLMWIIYASGGNAKIRINATDLVDELIPPAQGPSAADAVAYMGSLGSGGYIPSFRLAEMMIFPGQALSGAQITTREQGYFKTRYPTLGL